MIFKQIHEIVSGQKTQTRRVVKPGEEARYFPWGEIEWVGSSNGKAKWRLWNDYAVVPKRGARTYIHEGHPLRIVITGIRQERLHDITEEDAQAEGVRDCAEYKRLWRSINKTRGTRWDDNPLVWVIEFCIADHIVATASMVDGCEA